ncbi:MAG: hypothetical protein NTW51_10350 [Cyanobacteria bacterium]|jgi:hypothetical protein|nr:hypothetical protein [Cyanobacteriota bacterium]MCX5956779.1 hypothetical protein [Cyanobacteriota bacterium]MCX5959550.1 hypothetical protein [Cyanobacteriota bacterium]
MPRVPRRFHIHLMLEGGHEQVVEFRTLDDFQKWYGGVLTSAAPDAFVNVPLEDLELEYLVLRASSVIAIRVEPLFASVQD